MRSTGAYSGYFTKQFCFSYEASSCEAVVSLLRTACNEVNEVKLFRPKGDKFYPIINNHKHEYSPKWLICRSVFFENHMKYSEDSLCGNIKGNRCLPGAFCKLGCRAPSDNTKCSSPAMHLFYSLSILNHVEQKAVDLFWNTHQSLRLKIKGCGSAR